MWPLWRMPDKTGQPGCAVMVAHDIGTTLAPIMAFIEEAFDL
jgi:hypothetical protein